MQDFHADEGGVSIVISVLMLLGIFMGAYAMYMSVSLPQEFEAKEKEHMQKVRESFVELQGAVQQMSAGEARSIGVPMSASLVSGTFRGPNIAGRLRANASLVDGGAVGCWLMDEGSGNNVYDETRYQNHGIDNGATWVAGRDNVGMALNFDGDNDVRVPDSNSLDITSAITIEAWAKPASAQTSSWPTFFGKSDAYIMHTNSTLSTVVFTVFPAPGSGRQTISGTSLTGNTWVHLVGTYDGRYGKIYINGNPNFTQDFGSTAQINTNDNSAFIGNCRGLATTYGFKGVVDEVRIYKRALSADEIKARYQARENYYGRIAFDVQNAYYVPQTYVYEDGAVILVQDNRSSMVSDPPLVAVRDREGDNIEVTLQTVNLLGTSEIITTGTATVTATGDNFQTTAPAAPNLENVTIVVYSIYRDAWKDYLKRLAKSLRDKGIESTVVDLEHLQLTIYGKKSPGENDIYFMKRSREAGMAIF